MHAFVFYVSTFQGKGVTLSIILLSSLLSSCAPARDDAAATYVGVAACTSCHGAAYEAWSSSHHDRSMLVADSSTVLGRFDGHVYKDESIEAAFSQEENRFYVKTAGADGAEARYEVGYTFGFYPLQQYLLAFPNGKYQAFSLAWDSRSSESGGQRWFNLYDHETVLPGDLLHWSGPNMNWNYMCADCHSTNLKKGYELESDTYLTSWSDINVSCEACHGPGSKHVASAEKYSDGHEKSPDTGFAFQFPESEDSVWQIDPITGNARPRKDRQTQRAIDTCARCHSRRVQLKEGFEPGRNFLDHYQPVLLEDGLYYADGQINDEVYVYGSFLQSKMYAAGVWCSDCHDAHDLSLKREENNLCLTCHSSSKYDERDHHRHEQGSQAAACVTCHMPSKTYMKVDDRRDHSFVVPSPAMSAAVGSPDVCASCHPDRARQWLQRQLGTDPADSSSMRMRTARSIQRAQRADPGADQALYDLLKNPDAPAIVRATGISLLENYKSVFTVQGATDALVDEDPLMRRAAVHALELLEPAERWRRVAPMLKDPVLAVRGEAARILNPIARQFGSADELAPFEAALSEYVDTQMTNADRPEAHLNLGVMHLGQNRLAEAEAAFRTAISIDSMNIAASVNLSDVYRLRSDDTGGEAVLRTILGRRPEAGEAHHALGLNLIRQNRHDEALSNLRYAAEYTPENPRYPYVYAVALHSRGDTEAAIDHLEKARVMHTRNRDLLFALATFYRDAGQSEKSREVVLQLIAVFPQDSAARQFLNQLNTSE